MFSPPLGLVEASRLAGVSPECVRQWCLRHSIGELTPAGWRIDREKFDRLVEARALFKGVAA